ncbi:MAG: penicillin acylase family protein [Pseudomonadota bacterium]
MIKTVRRLFVALTFAVVAAAAGVYLYVRASLPPTSGELVAAVTAPVSIERDAAGIASITAATREDLAFGTGFAHAQDRFFQMDLLRRQSAGELSALVGRAAVSVDKRYRIHRFRHRAQVAMRALPLKHRRTIEAYAAGVNAGLDSLSARPFEYLLLNAQPTPWLPEDSFLVVFSMFLELNDELASRDIGRGFARLALSRAQFEWMYPAGSVWDAPLVDAEYRATSIPGEEDVDLRSLSVSQPFQESPADIARSVLGSNNWAVSGELTADGRAIVANDMHLGINAPNIWYRALLRVEGEFGLEVSGVSLPGTPVVIAGSNGHVAWAFTNSRGDWTDAVLLEPGEAPDTYRTPEGDRAFDSVVETIDIKDGASEQVVVRETVWGPVLQDAGYPGGEIAISWIAHYPEALNFNSIDLEQAQSVAEAVAVANRAGIPPQNFVVGDTDGNVAWTIAGQIPVRSTAPAEHPGDWSTGGGWQGWLSPDDFPRVINPASGRIWTANARVASGENLRKMGDGGYSFGARQQQIRDALLSRDQFAVDDMLTIHLDDRALFLGRWRELLLELLDDDALAGISGRARFHQLVENWTARAAADAVGYRLVRGFRRTVQNRVFDMLTTPIVERFGADVARHRSNQFEEPLWQLVTEQPPHLLTADYPDWRTLLLGVVDEMLAYYADNYDDGLENRTWGEQNTAAFRHPLSQAVPALAPLLDLPAEPLPGDNDMPRVQGRTYGASERFAVSPGDEANGYLHMPGGQSGHPLSEHYRDGHEDWVEGRPSPFLPGVPKAKLTLTPAP